MRIGRRFLLLSLAATVLLSLCMGTLGSVGGDEPLIPRVLPEKPAHTRIGPGDSRERIHLKLQEGSGVRLRDGSFVSLTSRDVTALNGVLSQYPETRAHRLFSRSEADLAADQRRLEATTGKDLADLNLWYRLVVGPGADPEGLIDALNSLDIVEIAYAEPLPAPPPQTPDYEGGQGYLDPAPTGIGARLAWTGPGGGGTGIRVVDIEYSWNTSHEDLSKAPGALIPNGTPQDPFNNNNHGTAVLGELVADRNGFGVTGIVYGATLGLVNANNQESGYDLANAINLASANTTAGDVILIEQQTAGPAGACSQPSRFIPVEYVQAYFDAIQNATLDGRIVVEPAGNGGCDLDNAAAYGNLFNRGFRDSQAIIVGAGASGVAWCTTPARSRLAFSTYGSRVDAQGWGECVVTTGYGDGGPNPNQYYTSTFSGTSSASPIVAGAAVAVQANRIAVGRSKLGPVAMRARLVDTGTPQDTTVPGHIGPLPNLEAALFRPTPYKCYGILGFPLWVPVSLETRFGLEPNAIVTGVGLLCEPAKKDGVGDLWETPYKVYSIVNTHTLNIHVDLETQFGREEDVLVGQAGLLWEPAKKNGMGDLTQTPYKCYAISDTHNPNVRVNLETQFGLEEDVLVGPAKYLCEPAKRNGVGDLTETPYKCYQIFDTHNPNFGVDLETYFGLEEDVWVRPASLLCEPAARYYPAEPVGGIAQLPEAAQAPASRSASSDPPYAALAGGLAAAVVALTAGAWYARRRWMR